MEGGGRAPKVSAMRGGNRISGLGSSVRRPALSASRVKINATEPGEPDAGTGVIRESLKSPRSSTDVTTGWHVARKQWRTEGILMSFYV